MHPTILESKITEDEAKIYDRQIRLWGLDAQKRLRAARVLIIGLGGLGAEIAKNIILAGVKSVHFLDDKKVDENDFQSQFFLRKEHLGNSRATCSVQQAQLLNPMVDVTAEDNGILEKPIAFFKNYDVICLTDSDWSIAQKLDESCRKYGLKLFVGGVFGLYGYMLSDLGTHEYAVDVAQKKPPSHQKKQNNGEPDNKRLKLDETDSKTIKKVVEFVPFKGVLNYDWSDEKHSLRLRKTPTGYFLCKLMSDFKSKFHRLPTLERRDEDEKELMEIRAELVRGWKIEEKYIPSEYFEECYYGEVSPTCAVVGGVIGQEIIKVVSKKDNPHNNFFFFDGIQGCGMVDRIGGED